MTATAYLRSSTFDDLFLGQWYVLLDLLNSQ